MLLLTGRTVCSVPGTAVLCLAVAAPWGEWGIPLGRGFLWGTGCTPRLLPQGCSGLGLASLLGPELLSSLGAGKSWAGSPGQGTGGDFLCALLCEWNDSMCKDAFFYEFQQRSVMELSPYLQCVAKSNKWQWLYCRKKEEVRAVIFWWELLLLSFSGKWHLIWNWWIPLYFHQIFCSSQSLLLWLFSLSLLIIRKKECMI